jgi:oxygen-independent coproporphyrinogen-3 oxidase
MARAAGFRRISCDLMIGIPGQDPARAIRDAEVLAEAGASHLSIYMLDLDKACPLKRQVEEGLVTLPDEDTVADAFEALQTGLPALGLLPYEISNYAAEGEQSRHNTRYWQRRPYLGLGPSAASHLGPWRWSEPSGLPAWLSGQELGEFQILDAAAELAEVPLLGLRMLCGVDWEALRRQGERQELSRLVAGWEAALEPFFRHGLLEREGAVVRFTRRGLLLSNAVLETFI